MTTKEIRQGFLEFFANKAHQIVPSAPIVVKNDPTLMFTNAGINQFKDLFLGQAAIKYSRVADTQRCLRVSGKHNDLEEVGIDVECAILINLDNIAAVYLVYNQKTGQK